MLSSRSWPTRAAAEQAAATDRASRPSRATGVGSCALAMAPPCPLPPRLAAQPVRPLPPRHHFLCPSPFLTSVDQAVDADAHKTRDDCRRDGDEHRQGGAPARLCRGTRRQCHPCDNPKMPSAQAASAPGAVPQGSLTGTERSGTAPCQQRSQTPHSQTPLGPGRLLRERREPKRQVSAPRQPSPAHRALTAGHIRGVRPFCLHHQPLLLAAAGRNETM